MPRCWWAGEAAVHFRLVPRGLQQLQEQEKGNPGSLPGECGGRGGVRAPGSVWPGSAYRLRGDCPVRARAGPGGKELSEWHFLSDLRVLGTVGRRSLRGGATGLGSEIPDPPPSLARYPDCGGSQRLRAPGVVGRGPGPNSGAAGRQESSWIRESCWREARSPPAGCRLLGDLEPASPGLGFLGYEEGSEVP